MSSEAFGMSLWWCCMSTTGNELTMRLTCDIKSYYAAKPNLFCYPLCPLDATHPDLRTLWYL